MKLTLTELNEYVKNATYQCLNEGHKKNAARRPTVTINGRALDIVKKINDNDYIIRRGNGNEAHFMRDGILGWMEVDKNGAYKMYNRTERPDGNIEFSDADGKIWYVYDTKTRETGVKDNRVRGMESASRNQGATNTATNTTTNTDNTSQHRDVQPTAGREGNGRPPEFIGGNFSKEAVSNAENNFRNRNINLFNSYNKGIPSLLEFFTDGYDLRSINYEIGDTSIKFIGSVEDGFHRVNHSFRMTSPSGTFNISIFQLNADNPNIYRVSIQTEQHTVLDRSYSYIIDKSTKKVIEREVYYKEQGEFVKDTEVEQRPEPGEPQETQDGTSQNNGRITLTSVDNADFTNAFTVNGKTYKPTLDEDNRLVFVHETETVRPGPDNVVMRRYDKNIDAAGNGDVIGAYGRLVFGGDVGELGICFVDIDGKTYKVEMTNGGLRDFKIKSVVKSSNIVYNALSNINSEISNTVSILGKGGRVTNKKYNMGNLEAIFKNVSEKTDAVPGISSKEKTKAPKLKDYHSIMTALAAKVWWGVKKIVPYINPLQATFRFIQAYTPAKVFIKQNDLSLCKYVSGLEKASNADKAQIIELWEKAALGKVDEFFKQLGLASQEKWIVIAFVVKDIGLSASCVYFLVKYLKNENNEETSDGTENSGDETFSSKFKNALQNKQISNGNTQSAQETTNQSAQKTTNPSAAEVDSQWAKKSSETTTQPKKSSETTTQPSKSSNTTTKQPIVTPQVSGNKDEDAKAVLDKAGEQCLNHACDELNKFIQQNNEKFICGEILQLPAEAQGVIASLGIDAESKSKERVLAEIYRNITVKRDIDEIKRNFNRLIK